jgi:hypothetical protein
MKSREKPQEARVKSPRDKLTPYPIGGYPPDPALAHETWTWKSSPIIEMKPAEVYRLRSKSGDMSVSGGL